ncbi:zinc transporter foi isoform X2 [Chelonus insularis]|uniref:zinc transporter foi isoform X2 n=1 Tax=Chelonus insularis TaxID=460826 RepID=UPI00158B52F9|nr:zinc transporter foi isoform X2 [Chelonus insularis]
MSKHFMTVCVVCVLCAAHTPCSAHISKSSSTTTTSTKHQLLTLTASDNDDNNIKSDTFIRKSSTMMNNRQKSVDPAHPDEIHPKENNQLKRFDQAQIKFPGNNNNDNNNNLSNHHHHNHDKKYDNNKIETHRRKRHIDYEEKYFLQKIFDHFGDGKSLTMEGFETMLKKLGLVELITNIEIDKDIHETHENGSPDGVIQNPNTAKTISTSNSNYKQKCMTKKELLTNISPNINLSTSTKNDTILPEWLFERLCPVLIYHLSSNSSLERNGCILSPDSYEDITKMNDEYSYSENTRNMVQVWIYSTISIVIISLCGLLGVAVIPVMGKSYYYQLLQFLVALAIGTLCGDALIHLLPHAMMSPHSHDFDHDHLDHVEAASEEDLHNLNMWKGVVAMMGLILFFFTEKALSMISEWRKYRQRKNKLPSRVRVMREIEGLKSNSVGEKLCKHKYSSYPYCYGEITTTTAMKGTTGAETEVGADNKIVNSSDPQDNQDNSELNYNDKEHLPTIEESKPLTNSNCCNPVTKLIKNDLDLNVNNHDSWTIDDNVHSNRKNNDNLDITQDDRESYTVIIREHENKHHGHTHSHGHVHAAPETMSSVAWMVIMGDGLHNFTDGMAIGAAFAANIAGGFSTAIAVFCHELPHELGDFAVLLKAGMSAKQAVFYNLLSSVLCLFGMIFGVLLGTTPATTSWVFAAAAGMFIYIALVDMIPELSSGHAEESGSHWQCVLQALGLITGLGIMLIIALYEHDLKHIFTN